MGPHLKFCPWCNESGAGAAMVLQRQPDVRLLSCRNCSARYADRMPTPETLTDYYASYYSDSDDPSVTHDSPKHLAAHISRYCSRQRISRVLDLGGGDGTISRHLMQILGDGGEVIVVDPASEGRTWKQDGVNFRGLGDLAALETGATFDLVLASAVLEHLPNPRPILEELLQRVESGGLIYVRTPAVAPFIRAVARVGVSVDFTYPGHLFDLGQPFWDRLGEWLPAATRFSVLASKPSPPETSLRHHPLRTVVSVALKAPWRVLGRRWPYVGGWEWVAQRT